MHDKLISFIFAASISGVVMEGFVSRCTHAEVGFVVHFEYPKHWLEAFKFHSSLRS